MLSCNAFVSSSSRKEKKFRVISAWLFLILVFVLCLNSNASQPSFSHLCILYLHLHATAAIPLSRAAAEGSHWSCTTEQRLMAWPHTLGLQLAVSQGDIYTRSMQEKSRSGPQKGNLSVNLVHPLNRKR
ncbi:uncharacterized protein EI97DRAFT_201923 [Westerdykella ornata]|uniref:Uncharacterized protein n=1 Tax=Westerdykella ornata TaxID=318751 RepID=A0A6A6J9H4_WESOR|nr:uncharacterized protein EI97DRAFT_201923 [Westerdykella ornata]KAF2272638.1 hypothetical protein EI97DRAFT_201923 [Westerdykella ornata]